MKDIVGRLRDGLSNGPNTSRTPWGRTIEEAASAIERMQKEIELLVREREDYNGAHQRACLEIAKLKDALAKIANGASDFGTRNLATSVLSGIDL